jgi:ribosomal protein S18 acetylase RimI-like enzyme
MRLGHRRLRAAPWRADRTVVQLTPVPGSPPPDATLVHHCLAALAGHGYREAITAALGPAEQRPFLAAGFVCREELHLLVHDLDELPPRADDPSLRRPHRHEWDAMAAIDGRAFEGFWHLDAVGIAEAAAATPTARVRVSIDPAGRLSGYAVAGRSSSRGYVQRVAVDPADQGSGIGSALTLDGLRWMARRGSGTALVNTQLRNERALALYLRLGFQHHAERLAVLTHPLQP